MPLQYDKSQKTVENPTTCQGFVCSGQPYSSTSGSDMTKRGLHVDVYCITHYQAALENERRYCHTINPLNPELNPICYLLALLAQHFLHVSRIRVKSLTLRLLMSYIYGAPILDVSRSHTTTQHSR